MKTSELHSLNGCLVLNNIVAHNDVIETETKKSFTYVSDGDKA